MLLEIETQKKFTTMVGGKKSCPKPKRFVLKIPLTKSMLTPNEKREKVLQNISERFIPLRKCLLTKTGEQKNKAEKKPHKETPNPRKK